MIDQHLSYAAGRRTRENAGLTIVDLLRRQVNLAPDNIAVVYNDFSITYRCFDGLTDDLASKLIRLGIVPGARVGIFLNRSEMIPISIFGVLKASAAYIPLNPKHPRHYLLEMVNSAGINYIISEKSLYDSFAEFEGSIVDVRSLIGELSQIHSALPQETPTQSALPDDLMAILFTSGSSGSPKGVMIYHKHPITNGAYYRNVTGLSIFDAVASYVDISFVIHMIDFFPAFMAGATLHIIDDNIRLDTGKINEYFEAHNITVAILPTAFGRRFMIQEENHSLRTLMIGGDIFNPIAKTGFNFTLFNLYGFTECAGGVAMGAIKPDEKNITVGRVSDNLDICILDDQNRLVPRGEKGELCIAGPAVSGGYLNQPEKTRQVFIKNPYSDETGYETLYKSGDLASISENGDIKIWGRVDFQIKIRGYRIEPGAIDTYVLQYPGITEAVTVAVDGSAGIKRLVTYIVAEKKIDPKTLRDFIADFLPPYMVPQGIEQIDKLPRNTNGKIDRSKLPEPTYMVVNKDYTPAETETEKKLSRLWALSLGVEAEKIGLYDDFFELGGDSLRAVLLSLEISKAFGADVSPAELFKARSIKQQADILAISKSFNPIYTYTTGADKTPLFFAHGGNIGAEAYAPLAQKLPPNQPFYCFENHNIFNFGSRIKGITHLAETYTKYLKEMAPHGPYILGGWSFGGLVSFEMAVQLEKNGDVVEHLYLLDPTLIRTEEEKKLRGKLREISNYREYLKHDPLFERFRNMGLLDRLVENDNEIAKDMEQYVPTAAYRGEATLFKAVKPDPVNPDSPPEVLDIKRRLEFLTLQRRDNGFGGYIRNLRIIEIPEIHDGFMRGEALDTIAAVIGGHTPQHPAI